MRIHHKLEISHHVPYLRPVEEGVAGVDHVRDIALAQGLLDGARLRIGPIEHGKILILGTVLAHAVNDAAGDQDSLLLLVVRADKPYLLPFFAYGVALFRDAVLVPGYQRIGRTDYHLGGTVVALQPENLAFRIILAETQDILDLGPSESIDGLRVVTHDADVVVRFRQALEDQILSEVRILVLVH